MRRGGGGGLSVKQPAILGKLLIPDSSGAKEPGVLWYCVNKNRREQYFGTKQCFYPAERAGGTRVLERCLASKERAAPHTPSVDTRATDMEK